MASCEQCQGEDGKEHPSAGPELLTCLPTWGREGGRNSWGVLGGVFPNPSSLHSTATSSAKPEGADPDYPSSPVPPFFLIWNILNSLESDQKCSPAPPPPRLWVTGGQQPSCSLSFGLARTRATGRMPLSHSPSRLEVRPSRARSPSGLGRRRLRPGLLRSELSSGVLAGCQAPSTCSPCTGRILPA